MEKSGFPTAEEFISQCYRHFLLRDPATEEIAAWNVALESGSVTACRLPERFRSSPEFAALRSTVNAKKIGFLHIPKTAGTSFGEWLRGLYFENEIYDIARTRNPDMSQAGLVLGHLHLSTLRDSERTHIFTILRDPAERLISLYRFGRSNLSGWPVDDPVKSLSFEDWLKCSSPEAVVHRGFYAGIVLTADEQCERSPESLVQLSLQRYANLAAVGLQEELPSFLARIAAILALPTTIYLTSLNTAERNTSFVSDYPKKPHLSASCCELLKEVTKVDYAIYNHFRNGKLVVADSQAHDADKRDRQTSVAGSVTARSAPTRVAGAFDLNVVLDNQSETAWPPEAVVIRCQWFDAEWNLLPSATDKQPLLLPGVSADSTQEIHLTVRPPAEEGRYHLMLALARSVASPCAVSAQEFTPLVLDFEVRAPVETNRLNESKESLRLAIVGSPRSGNVWLNRVLSDLLSLTPCYAHTPDEVAWSALPERSILQLHWTPEESFKGKLDRLGFVPIVLQRHPLDLLISILHFCRHEPLTARWLQSYSGDESSILDATPIDQSFVDYACSNRAAALLSLSSEWEEQAGAISVRYEKLVTNPTDAVSAVLSQLGAKVDEHGIQSALEKHSLSANRQTASNSHFWMGTPGLWRRLILANDAIRIALRHKDLFAALGYDIDPDNSLTAGSALQLWHEISRKPEK
jgi:hypothetical protein